MNTRLEEIDLQSAASNYAVQGSTSEQNEWGRLVGYKRGYNDAWDEIEQRISQLESDKLELEIKLTAHKNLLINIQTITVNDEFNHHKDIYEMIEDHYKALQS